MCIYVYRKKCDYDVRVESNVVCCTLQHGREDFNILSL